MKRFLIVLGFTVPLTVLTVFAPGGGFHELTIGIVLWDLGALLLTPPILFVLIVRGTPSKIYALCLALALILCSVWTPVYYPISRVFILGRMVGETGLASLLPLSLAEIIRVIYGNCFLVCGCIAGACLAVLKMKKDTIRTTPLTVRLRNTMRHITFTALLALCTLAVCTLAICKKPKAKSGIVNLRVREYVALGSATPLLVEHEGHLHSFWRGYVEKQTNSPNSPTQEYRLTDKGRALLDKSMKKGSKA